MVAVVFLGPTLPVDRAREVLPDAVYLPPAGQGDVAAAVVRYRPGVVALVDGVFRERLAVWHKELLWAQSQGCVVAGAASMGALRATELAPHGMIGVGDVFSDFAEGRLTDHDEVAVLHGGAEDGWRALTVALVDVRATAEALVRDGSESAEAAAHLVDTAAALPFDERSWAGIARAAGLDPSAARRWREGAVGRKAADAVALLRLVPELLASPASGRPRALEAEGGLLRAMLARDRPLVDDDGITDVTPADLVAHAAVSRPDFAELNEAALDRGAALHLAGLLEIAPGADAITAARDRLADRLAVQTEEGWDEWCSANDLTRSELDELVHDEARLAQLRSWLMATTFKVSNVKLVADELRRRGALPAAKAAVVAADAALRRRHPDARTTATGDDLAGLLRAQILEGGLTVTHPVEDWLGDRGFASWDQLVSALERAAATRHRSPSDLVHPEAP